MTEFVIDSPTSDKLAAVSEPVQIVDADGNVLGTFQPTVPNKGHRLPPMSHEEMRRHASQPGGRTLPEILKDLEESA